MNILIVPEYFNGRNLDGISQMSSFEDLIRGWPNESDYFYVMVGKKSKKFGWSRRSMARDLGRSALLEFDVPGDDLALEGPLSHKTLSTEELNFLLRVNTLPNAPVIDVVINRRREATRLIDYAVHHGANRRILVISIIGDAKVKQKGKSQREDDMDAVIEQISAGWLPCMFQTAMDRKLMMLEAARNLAATPRQSIRKAPVIHFPMNWGAMPVEDIRKRREETRESLPRFGHFGSFWAKKRVSEMMDVLEGMRALHPELKMIVTTQGPRVMGKFRRPWAEVHFGTRRYEYYQHLHKADIVVVTSTNETTGRAYWEQLVSGIDLMFWDAYWLKEFIGDFPFVAKTQGDRQAMVRAVLKSKQVYDRLKAENVKLRSRITEMLDHRVVAENVKDVIDEKMPKFKTFKFVDELVAEMKPKLVEVAGDGRILTLDIVDKISEEFTKNGRSVITKNRMVSARQVADSLQKAGFEVVW